MADQQPINSSALLPTDPADKLLERLRAATTGEYEIYGELGRGGMATVYLAHEISLDRKVAIKVMAPGMVYSTGLVERFKREARTAANLSHPNIIPIYAVREVDDLLFCVIKLVKGTPLDAIMRELGQLPIAMVQAILAQVGDALGYAHRHGVVHRDVKPGNILIDDDGWAVVTDFGIAKVPELEGLTLTGVAVGTPTYMSPEQGGGGEVTGAADQYSLGVVAYEMLAGRPPFTGTSMMAVLYSHFHDPPPSLEELRPDCPPELRDAVMRMLSKEPADRWPSLEDATAAMGARPLARDDPTRSQLITLARSGTSHRIVSQLRTPQSPIPLSNRRHDASRGSAARWRPALLAAGAVVLLGAGFLIARVAADSRRDDPSAVTEPTVSAVKDDAGRLPDSVQGDRQLPPPPASVPEGKSSAVSPQTPSRSTAIAKARTDSAVPKVPARPVPNVTSPPPPTPTRAQPESTATVDSSALRAQVKQVPITAPARTVTVAPPIVDEQAAVGGVIVAFARAIAARDLATARRLYPGMPNEQREGFEAVWNGGGTLTPRWTVSDIVVEGSVATARVRGTTLVTLRRGTSSEEPVNLRARLERRGAEWRLVALIN